MTGDNKTVLISDYTGSLVKRRGVIDIGVDSVLGEPFDRTAKPLGYCLVGHSEFIGEFFLIDISRDIKVAVVDCSCEYVILVFSEIKSCFLDVTDVIDAGNIKIQRIMSPTAEKDRAAARCDECGNIYTVNIHSEGEVAPIGVPTCRGCGGSEFTIFGEHEETLIQTDE